MSWDTILTCAVAVASIFISFILGRLELRLSSRRSSYRERYENLYVPYIKKLYRGFLWENSIKDMPLETRAAFLDLLSNHLEYLGRETQKSYPLFYHAFLCMLEYDNGNPEYHTAPDEFERCFWDITFKILKEAQRLSRKLQLPDLTATISSKLSSNL